MSVKVKAKNYISSTDLLAKIYSLLTENSTIRVMLIESVTEDMKLNTITNSHRAQPLIGYLAISYCFYDS
jgi:hypothetical protein